jgi:transcriptional regulator with XRE-family HTH domain
MVYKTREEMLKVLGENLKSSRLAENLSQQTVADRSGISLKAVRNLEAGENSSTLSLLSYCRTIRKIDWLMSLAPPEVDASLFERRDVARKRQRAGRSGKAVRHG